MRILICLTICSSYSIWLWTNDIYVSRNYFVQFGNKHTRESNFYEYIQQNEKIYLLNKLHSQCINSELPTEINNEMWEIINQSFIFNDTQLKNELNKNLSGISSSIACIKYNIWKYLDSNRLCEQLKSKALLEYNRLLNHRLKLHAKYKRDLFKDFVCETYKLEIEEYQERWEDVRSEFFIYKDEICNMKDEILSKLSNYGKQQFINEFCLPTPKHGANTTFRYCHCPQEPDTIESIHNLAKQYNLVEVKKINISQQVRRRIWYAEIESIG